MRKKMYIIVLILIIVTISSFSTKVQATDRNLTDLFFEIMYQKTEEKVLEELEKCTDKELENLSIYDQYYTSKADRGEAEIRAAIAKYDVRRSRLLANFSWVG